MASDEGWATKLGALILIKLKLKQGVKLHLPWHTHTNHNHPVGQTDPRYIYLPFPFSHFLAHISIGLVWVEMLDAIVSWNKLISFLYPFFLLLFIVSATSYIFRPVHSFRCSQHHDDDELSHMHCPAPMTCAYTWASLWSFFFLYLSWFPFNGSTCMDNCTHVRFIPSLTLVTRICIPTNTSTGYFVSLNFIALCTRWLYSLGCLSQMGDRNQNESELFSMKGYWMLGRGRNKHSLIETCALPAQSIFP